MNTTTAATTAGWSLVSTGSVDPSSSSAFMAGVGIVALTFAVIFGLLIGWAFLRSGFRAAGF